jgi:branched-chain amino acid transport system permease protein
VAGGYLVGLIEALAAGYLAPGYGTAITFVALLAVLFLRREGVFQVAQRRQA